jgi:nicotinate-nucleotide pyrophosphorylase
MGGRRALRRRSVQAAGCLERRAALEHNVMIFQPFSAI